MKTLLTLVCTAALSLPIYAFAECGGGSCDSKECTCEADCKACDGGEECTCEDCKCDGCKDS